MDALFLIGQVVWVAVLACGAYVSFSYYELADAEHAKTARPGKSAAHATPSVSRPSGFTSVADGV